MTIVEQVATAAELERLPDDGFRYELVCGELRKMTPAGNEHGRIAALLTVSLGQHVLANRLGSIYAAETGFRLASDPDTVRAPDAAFVSQARLDAVGAVAGYWPGAPDLVVEVVSPGDRYGEVAEKVADWLAAGTQMVVSSSRSSGRWRCIGLRMLWMYCEKAMCWRVGRWCRGGRCRSRHYSPSAVSKNA